MNLVYDTQYKVVSGHPHHPQRIGRFQFLGGPKSDVIVLADVDDDKVLFAVGMNDLTDFDPDVDFVIQAEHLQAIKMIDEKEEVFTILRRAEECYWTALWVHYPNCPNSHKIMVYEGNAPADDAKQIDPHFGRESSPVARFEATERGWQMARRFMRGETA